MSVNVTLLQCPIGFTLSNSLNQCVCEERLQKYTNICNISSLALDAQVNEETKKFNLHETEQKSMALYLFKSGCLTICLYSVMQVSSPLLVGTFCPESRLIHTSFLHLLRTRSDLALARQREIEEVVDIVYN